jgi:threonine dehydratase
VTGGDLDLARIEEAAAVVDPAFRDTPQFFSDELCAALGRQVLVKVETLNPLGSFKGRGADFLLRSLAPGGTVVCASSGNLGLAMAHAGRAHGVGVHIYVPATIDARKLVKMRRLGARVTVIDGDCATAARAHVVAHPDDLLVESHPALAEGAATIGVELLRAGYFDAVVLPVGGGSLITGVARWIKEHSPGTRVIGVCPEGAPSMARSWEAGRPVRVEPVTIAGGLAMSEPAPEVALRLRALVDDMLLVSDEAITAAMRVAAGALGLLLEPSGAAGLAAIAEHDWPDGRLATVLTGAEQAPDRLAR